MKILIPILLFLTIISCSTPSNEKTNDFSALIDLEGNAFNLDDLKGNVLILNIWATWCKPCIAEFESFGISTEEGCLRVYSDYSFRFVQFH